MGELVKQDDVYRVNKALLRDKLMALFAVCGVEATIEVVRVYGSALKPHMGPALWDALDKAIRAGRPLWSVDRILDAMGMGSSLSDTSEHRAINSWAAIGKERKLGYSRCMEWRLTDFERDFISESFGGIKHLCYADNEDVVRAQYVKHYQHRELAYRRRLEEEGASPMDIAEAFTVRRTRAEYDARHPRPALPAPAPVEEVVRPDNELSLAYLSRILNKLHTGVEVNV